MKSKLIYPIPSHGILMGIPWDGMGQAWTAMEWDGTENYVPRTSLQITKEEINDFLQKIQAYENAHSLTHLDKEVFIPNEKRLSTPALKGIGVSKSSTNKVFM